jgi:putative FmdB family regulatory protein
MLANDYICVKCGEKFKAPLNSVDCKSTIKCPACGAEGAEKVVYARDRSSNSCCSSKHYG